MEHCKLREVLSNDPWVDIADPQSTLSGSFSPVKSPSQSRSSTPELIEKEEVKDQYLEQVHDDRIAQHHVSEHSSESQRQQGFDDPLEAFCINTWKRSFEQEQEMYMGTANRERIRVLNAECMASTEIQAIFADVWRTMNTVDKSVHQGEKAQEVVPEPTNLLAELEKLKKMNPMVIMSLMKEPQYKEMLQEIFTEDYDVFEGEKEEFEKEKARFKQREYTVEMKAYHNEECFEVWRNSFGETAEILEAARLEIERMERDLRDEQQEVYEKERSLRMRNENLRLRNADFTEKSDKFSREVHGHTERLTKFNKSVADWEEVSKDTTQLKNDVLNKLKDVRVREERVEQNNAIWTRQFERVEKMERDVLTRDGDVRGREKAVEKREKAISAQEDRVSKWEATVMTVQAESKEVLEKLAKKEKALNRKAKTLTESSKMVEDAAKIVKDSQKDLQEREEKIKAERSETDRQTDLTTILAPEYTVVEKTLWTRENRLAELAQAMRTRFTRMETSAATPRREVQETMSDALGLPSSTPNRKKMVTISNEEESRNTGDLQSKSQEMDKSASKSRDSSTASIDLNSVSTWSYFGHCVLAFFLFGPWFYLDKTRILKRLISMTSSMPSHRDFRLRDRIAALRDVKTRKELGVFAWLVLALNMTFARFYMPPWIFNFQVITLFLAFTLMLLIRYGESRGWSAADWKELIVTSPSHILDSAKTTVSRSFNATGSSLKRFVTTLRLGQLVYDDAYLVCQSFLVGSLLVKICLSGLFNFQTIVLFVMPTSLFLIRYEEEISEADWEQLFFAASLDVLEIVTTTTTSISRSFCATGTFLKKVATFVFDAEPPGEGEFWCPQAMQAFKILVFYFRSGGFFNTIPTFKYSVMFVVSTIGHYFNITVRALLRCCYATGSYLMNTILGHYAATQRAAIEKEKAEAEIKQVEDAAKSIIPQGTEERVAKATEECERRAQPSFEQVNKSSLARTSNHCLRKEILDHRANNEATFVGWPECGAVCYGEGCSVPAWEADYDPDDWARERQF